MELIWVLLGKTPFYNHTTQGSLKECVPAEPLALKMYLFKETTAWPDRKEARAQHGGSHHGTQLRKGVFCL